MTTESPFLRSAMLLGEENVRRLARSAVLLCGVGGVGSYVAEGLARAGVGRIGLVDHDRVALSNCNRQLIALHSTLGQPKAQAAAQQDAEAHPHGPPRYQPRLPGGGFRPVLWAGYLPSS